MIEAELKARLSNPDAVRAALARRAKPETAVYSDVYSDTAGGALEGNGRELRVRTIRTDIVRHQLTFKEPAIDEASQSKPEHETTVTSVAATKHIIQALGYAPFVSLTKECENYRFSDGGRDFLATVVRVPEVDGTFLEVETMAAEDEVDQALAAVRGVLAELGVPAEALTSETYTGAVRAARKG